MYRYSSNACYVKDDKVIEFPVYYSSSIGLICVPRQCVEKKYTSHKMKSNIFFLAFVSDSSKQAKFFIINKSKTGRADIIAGLFYKPAQVAFQ